MKYRIEDAVNTGENNLLILCKTSIWASSKYHTMLAAMNCIEPIVLHGNFATKGGEKIPHLSPLLETLSMDDWGKQGFPYYSGDITYHCTLNCGKAPIVEIPNPGEAAVELWLNGKLLDTKLWKPYRFDLMPFWQADGINKLDIRLVGTVGNLFPRAFWNRKLSLRPFGLLEPVVIL